MADKAQEIGYVKQRELTQEMEESYIDYAMSVIVSRALPDVRDGLKPVHRRILYTMYEEGLGHSSKFRKSATVVGSCLGRYHPHGDMAVYDAMVRLAQDFSLRYPLVQGQGNFGCFTKDTKVRLTDGRSLTFGELIKEQKAGKRHWTYSFNQKSNAIKVAEIRRPRLTRKKAELVEVELDNGQKIRCTPDHRFMLRDGTYRQAEDLQCGESLMPLYTKVHDGVKDKNLKGYELVFQPLGRIWEFAHHLADAWNLQRGMYLKSAGRVRHHLDFNKHNNNPDNIKRMQWEEHWRAHYEIASWRHKHDSEYVEKLAAGRKRFIENNRDVLSLRATKRNKKLWKDPEYRARRIAAVQAMWRDPEYKERMRKSASENLKRLWQREDFQVFMSELKSAEMQKRWKEDKNYRRRVQETLRKASIELWRNPAHREHISQLMKEKSKNPAWRKRQSKISKALWQDAGYRAKYPKDHFRNMANTLWAKKGVHEMHREKFLLQWQNPEFRRKALNAAEVARKRRMKENPSFMRELTAKAKITLRKNWKDPAYKERVMKSKILGFVSSLLQEHSKLTPAIYEQERTNNGIPRIEKATEYFGSFGQMAKEAQTYNHKVVSVRRLRNKEDVYDITVDPWHNFVLDAGVFVHNSLDNDPPAHQRYTEARMSRAGEVMLQDIGKETVDFVDNYDGSRKEPVVLPSPLPQLLLNGTLGIAVGMATNIPSHNLSEIIDALLHLIDNPKATTEDLFAFVKGPDFPTGGIIFNKKEILAAYSQGRGPIVMRGKAEIVESEKTKHLQIIISEIPYQVMKSTLVEQFAKLVGDKKIDGIRDIRDESDKDGLRVVFDLQRDAHPQKILNRLYKFSDLQRTFHLNMLALVDGIQPQTLSLDQVLSFFIKHRVEVVERRTKYELKRAKEREHILEGLQKCLAKIDEVIRIIKSSENREDAETKLMKRFKLSEIQANAILETRLAALARLARKQIEDELKEMRARIQEYTLILNSPAKIKSVIKKELQEMKDTFGDERRTRVQTQAVGEIAEEDLIPQEETIITLTQGGYIKRINPATYKLQKRGGKGIMGLKTVSDDIVEHFLYAETHDVLMVFTDSGKIFQTPVYEIPEGTRVSKGRGLLNFLEIGAQDHIMSLFAIGKKDVQEGITNIVMVTKQGIIKKSKLDDFKNVRRSGLIAMSLKKGDELRGVKKTTGSDEIILTTKHGQSIRFKEQDVRPMGRAAAGIHGIRLKKGDEVIGFDVVSSSSLKEKEFPYLLSLTENGYGKRTDLKEYRIQSRGGSGIKTANITAKTGALVYSKILTGEEEDLIVISRKAQIIRTAISSIPKISRSTQGVRIMRLDSGDKVASAACIS